MGGIALPILALALCAGSPLGVVRAQGRPVEPPQWATYMTFFEHVKSMELFADHIKAKGSNDKDARSTIRREYGLSEQEEKVIKEIAADTLRRQQLFRDERTKLVRQYTKEQWLSRAVPAEVAHQTRALQNKEIAAPDEAVVELKNRLGTARFSELDAAIRTKLGRVPYFFEQ